MAKRKQTGDTVVFKVGDKNKAYTLIKYLGNGNMLVCPYEVVEEFACVEAVKE